MPNILIVGATRGLGASLANQYASRPYTSVYGTTRSAEPPTGKGHDERIKWAKGIDLNQSDVGKKLVEELGSLGVEGGLDVVVSLCLGFVLWMAEGGGEDRADKVADHNSRVLRD